MRESKKNLKVVIFVFVAILCPLIPVALISLVKGRLPTLSLLKSFTIAHWISILGSFLPYVGTCAMGILALWQNEQLKRESRLSAERAQAINERLLKLEEDKYRPMIGFTVTGFDGRYIFVKLNNYKSESILDVRVTKLRYECGNIVISFPDIYLPVLETTTKLMKFSQSESQSFAEISATDAKISGKVSCCSIRGKLYSEPFQISFKGDSDTANLYFMSSFEKSSSGI